MLGTALRVYATQHRRQLFRAAGGSTAPVYATGIRQNVEFHDLPKDRVSPAGEYLDPWRHAFVFSIIGDTILVLSAGPDGRLGTADDISSDDKNT